MCLAKKNKFITKQFIIKWCQRIHQIFLCIFTKCRFKLSGLVNVALQMLHSITFFPLAISLVLLFFLLLPTSEFSFLLDFLDFDPNTGSATSSRSKSFAMKLWRMLIYCLWVVSIWNFNSLSLLNFSPQVLQDTNILSLVLLTEIQVKLALHALFQYDSVTQ